MRVEVLYFVDMVRSFLLDLAVFVYILVDLVLEDETVDLDFLEFRRVG